MPDDPAFVSFDTFPLKHRFLDPASGELAAHFSGLVAPLTAARASTIADEAAARCAERGAFSVTFRTDDSPGLVNGRLRDLPIADDATVIVSWNRSTAVRTTWGIFASHWDHFCYPAADDVSIVPAAGSWTLCYRRYEVIQFRSNPLPA